jgi:hypothetical protein
MEGLLADTAVLVRGDPESGWLVTFVVFSLDRILAHQLKFLEDLYYPVPLPDYMRPSMTIQVFRIPITSDGKRDEATLDPVPLNGTLPKSVDLGPGTILSEVET